MRNLSLNTKFMGVVIGISTSCCGIAWIGLSGMTAVSNDLTEIVKTVSLKKDMWSNIRSSQLSMAIDERDFLNDVSPELKTELSQRIEKEKVKIEEAIAKLEVISSSDDLAKIVDFKSSLKNWWSNHQIVRNKVGDGEKEAARKAAIGARAVRDNLASSAEKMVDVSERAMQSAYTGAQQHTSSAQQMVFILTIATVMIGLILSSFLIQQIRRSIDAVVRGLVRNSAQVEEASEQVAQSAVRLSQSTTEQAASLQQTAASAQEMTSMVQSNMANAKAATSITDTSQTSAIKGQEVVRDMAKAIFEINVSNQNIMDEVNESNTKISEITKVIAEIGNKTKVINDIVFQTKLLSFNASVEAARAGEHGRGFSVVAEEVGNLARMSGTAAKEISDMLDASLQKVDLIVREMKSNVEKLVIVGKEKVEAGQRIVDDCGGVLNEIVLSVGQVSKMSTDISTASQEQAQGIEEISRAVTQLDSVTQMNAGAAEQAASAADQLSNQAKYLKGAVQDLIVIVNGSGDSLDQSSASGNSSDNLSVNSSSNSLFRPNQKVPTKSKGSIANFFGSSKLNTKPKLTMLNAIAKSEKKTMKSSDNRRPGRKTESSVSLKLASGNDIEIPAEDDPRFKDI